MGRLPPRHRSRRGQPPGWRLLPAVGGLAVLLLLGRASPGAALALALVAVAALAVALGDADGVARLVLRPGARGWLQAIGVAALFAIAVARASTRGVAAVS